MKKVAVIIFFIIFLSSCAFSSHKTDIVWPDKIEYIEALCNIDMSWRDLKYSGTMSVKMRYPDTIQIEIYGPFGETEVYLTKNRDQFLFISSDGKFSDEKIFEKKFGIRLNEFIDDIAFVNYQNNGQKNSYFKRENYVVMYRFDNVENSICWKGNDGSVCMMFLEAVFEEKRQ